MLTLRLWQGFSFYEPGSGQDCLPSACSDLRGPMGALRHEVLAAMRRWLDSGQHDKGRQGSRAMQDMFVLGLEFALSKSDELAPHQITRIDLQDDMTFTGSAAAINRSWGVMEGVLAEAGHRLRSNKCGVKAPVFEQFEDAELPTEVRNLCLKIPRKRHGVSLLGSAANAQHCMHVGLGQPSEVPTQTIEEVEKALMTLQNIVRFACDQHDHVSFAKAWMLMSWGIAHALDYDFRLVPPAVMAPLQRRMEGGFRLTETLSLSWPGSEQSSRRALVVWTSELLRWVLRRKQRRGRLSTCTRPS